jgi:hypothetical protein
LPWDYQATSVSSALTGTTFQDKACVFLESIVVAVSAFVMPLICCSDTMGNKGAFIVLKGKDMEPQYTTYTAVVSSYEPLAEYVMF